MALVDGQLWQLTLTIIHMEYQRVLSSLSQSHAAMESGKLSRSSRLMTIAGKKIQNTTQDLLHERKEAEHFLK